MDLSSVLALTVFRFKVADFVRICPTDKVTVISLKPTFLPQHLALIRPFTGISLLTSSFLNTKYDEQYKIL